jgi:hypothetical protein
MQRNGVPTESVYLTDHRIAFGIEPDMTKLGCDSDD